MSNADAVWPIQTAIYTLLAADSGLSDDVTGVFDHVPEGTAFPYVTVGEFTGTPQYALDRFGQRTTVTLHCWSTYHGRKQIAELVGHLLRLLDHQTLSIDGHDTVAVRHEQTVTMRESDTDVRHAAVRFAITTEHAA